MLSHHSIRVKLRVGVGLLAASTCVLFCAALYRLYAYRGLAKSLSARSTELPLASELSSHVADLRLVLGQARERSLMQSGRSEGYDPIDYAAEEATGSSDEPAAEVWDLKLLREQYRVDFQRFKETLAAYRERLRINREQHPSRIAGDERERATLAEIDGVLDRIRSEHLDENLLFDDLGGETDSLQQEIDKLRELAAQLPSHLHARLHDLAGEVALTVPRRVDACLGDVRLGDLLLALATQVFRTAIARPVKLLVQGARKVAAGDFGHRITLDSRDEMGELAEAMNHMMAHFQQTRDELDHQVKERTQQVIRSEQLASVGFLAAGVAHEINNPLAAIAMCSESLESRLAELGADDPARAADWEIVRSYLETIGKESFRCKQITEKLLDFSRMGERESRATDLRDLVASVIDMVQHLGKYKNKTVELLTDEPVIAEVNAQEMKQVLLNLVTNGLDSLEAGGRVTVEVERDGANARVVVRDNGCGMTDEVKRHLFEPFFTRRRGGQGTGLGLSITYRIVEEHHGELTADSPGVGLGSSFTVTLPTEQPIGAIAA